MRKLGTALGRGTVALAFFVLGSGCATYQGKAVGADQSLPSREAGWIWVSGVPEVRQEGEKDCGPAALSAVLSYWGHRTTSGDIQVALGRGPGERVSTRELKEYVQGRGLDAYVLEGNIADVVSELKNGRPVIVGVAKRYEQRLLAHYEVVVGIHPSSNAILTLDPARGWRRNELGAFMTEWEPTHRVLVVVFPRVESRTSAR
jgi:ABC-type bacteriocin/lantibiotic exporter with double-glycine peptidase domain